MKKDLVKLHESVLFPNNLHYRTVLLAQAFRRRFQAILDPHNLTPLHWGVLCCLWREDGLPILTIAAELQQVAGTMTGVIDNMEKRELVRRERDPLDGRVWRVWLSETGDALKDVLIPLAQQLSDEIFSPLSGQELNDFSRIVDLLNEHLS